MVSSAVVFAARSTDVDATRTGAGGTAIVRSVDERFGPVEAAARDPDCDRPGLWFGS